MKPLRATEKAFRWLMLAYPPAFRRSHGLAMFELFRDEARAAHRERGVAGLVTVLTRAAIDTLTSAPVAWLERDARLNGSRSLDSPSVTMLARRAGPAGPGRPARLARLFRPARLGLSGIVHDWRVAARQLITAPGTTAVAVTMLAIGIGANITIFTAVNAVLLRPLASRDPDRVVRIIGRTATGAAVNRFSFPNFVDYRARATTLEDLTAVNLGTFILTVDRTTDQLLGEVVSGRYLSTLGAHTTSGRLLGDDDDRAGAGPVVLISDALWRRRFGSAPVAGRDVVLNGTHYTIVGVAAASVTGSFIGAPIDVWVPIATSGFTLGPGWDTNRAKPTVALIGRLREGVSRAQSQSELRTIASAVASEFDPTLKPIVDVLPGTLVTGDQRRLWTTFLTLLLGLVMLVLVIACANVGNLLLARVLGRRRELAVRVALGASRGRLARMLVVESLLIAGVAGAAALVASLWTSRLFANISPLPTLTLRFDLRPDARVVAFTALGTLVAAAVLAVVGSLQAMTPDIGPALKENATSAIGGRTPARLRGALATIQITVSLLLLVGAALLARSVRNAAAIDLGFEPQGVVALDVDTTGGRTDADGGRLFKTVVDRVSAVPGTEAAAVSTRAPLDSSTPLTRVSARESVSPSDSASPTATFLIVSARYFDVVKTRLVAGRAFDDRDAADRPAVAIVNEALAARLWPNGDALGRQLWLEPQAAAAACVVVGIARDSKYLTLGEARQSHVYLPFAQHPRRGMTILVRSASSPKRVIEATQDVLHSIDPNVQGFFARTLVEHVGVSLLPVRLAANVATAIGALALALAVVGLYSLVSFLVAERTAEIGLRVALGAGAFDTLRLVVGYGLRLTAIGLAIGIPAALAGSRLLASVLYDVSPIDPVVFVIVPAVVIAVALAACYVPARRAMRLDPVQALRGSG